MKRNEHIAHIRNLPIAELKKEISELEKKIQAHYLAIAFGKTKEVKTIANLKKQLARALTIAHERLNAESITTEPALATGQSKDK